MKRLNQLIAALLLSAAGAYADPFSIYLAPGNGNYFLPNIGATHFDAFGGYDSTGWVFDDITTLAGHAGEPIWASSVVINNTSSNTIQINMFNGLWEADGVGGGPGTLLEATGTVPVNIAPGQHTLKVYSGFPVPAGTFWAGYSISNYGTTATLADLNQIQFTYSDGATVGSSGAGFLESTSAGYLAINDPSTSPVSGVLAQQVELYNYAPEPSAAGLSLLGVAAIAGLRRWRMQVARPRTDHASGTDLQG